MVHLMCGRSRKNHSVLIDLHSLELTGPNQPDDVPTLTATTAPQPAESETDSSGTQPMNQKLSPGRSISML